MLKIDLSETTIDEIRDLEEKIEERKIYLKGKSVLEERVKNNNSYKNGYLSLFKNPGTPASAEATYTGYKRIPVKYKLNNNDIYDAFEVYNLNGINSLCSIEFPINNDEDGGRVTIRLLGECSEKIVDIGDRPYCQDSSIALDLHFR